MRRNDVLVFLGVAIASVLVSFLFVFAAVLTDGPASPFHPERLLQWILILTTHAVVAFVAGRFLPWPAWAAALILLVPDAAWLALGFGDQGLTPVMLGIAVCVLVGTLAGAVGGNTLRHRHRAGWTHLWAWLHAS